MFVNFCFFWLHVCAIHFRSFSFIFVRFLFIIENVLGNFDKMCTCLLHFSCLFIFVICLWSTGMPMAVQSFVLSVAPAEIHAGINFACKLSSLVHSARRCGKHPLPVWRQPLPVTPIRTLLLHFVNKAVPSTLFQCAMSQNLRRICGGNSEGMENLDKQRPRYTTNRIFSATNAQLTPGRASPQGTAQVAFPKP